MSGQYLGTIRFWNSEKRFGFATTDDGQEFYIGAAGLTGRTNIEGTRIQFDRQGNCPDAPWIRRLNDGKLRDMDGVDPRNPRPTRPPRVKPVAINVVVIDPSDPGGRSCTGPDPVGDRRKRNCPVLSSHALCGTDPRDSPNCRFLEPRLVIRQLHQFQSHRQ